MYCIITLLPQSQVVSCVIALATWENLCEKINTKEVVNWTTSLNEVSVSDGRIANS